MNHQGDRKLQQNAATSPGDHLRDCLISHHELNQAATAPANVVDGLFAIAASLEQVARAIRDLGNADAATPMGAMEALGLVFKDGLASIAIAIEDHTREETS